MVSIVYGKKMISAIPLPNALYVVSHLSTKHLIADDEGCRGVDGLGEVQGG